MTAFKSFLFLVFVPGTVAGFIPLYLIPHQAQIQIGIFAYLAFPFWIVGTVILLWCFWDFVTKGLGTPAPIDPPKELVVAGMYRFVRNPMYVGVLLVIFGHFLWFENWSLLIYALVVFIAFHTFVTLYEEPHLKKTFGDSCERYCSQVSCWVPIRFK